MIELPIIEVGQESDIWTTENEPAIHFAGQEGLDTLIGMIKNAWKNQKDFNIEVRPRKSGKPVRIVFERAL